MNITISDLANLVTLSGLEIILGIDNVIFIAILVGNLKSEYKNKVRIFGLSFALILRIIFLLFASHLMKMTRPLFEVYNLDISGRTILLLLGGLFLIYKAFTEIYKLFKELAKPHKVKLYSSPIKSVIQIIFIDFILSFDSIIVAVGITNNISIIIVAIFLAILMMIFSTETIGKFIEKYPSIKVIALLFILFIGIFLVLSAFGIHIDKGYLYFSMLFSCIIEAINISLARRTNIQGK